ncbi:MAG: DUF721 domain-containing protein [Candidatus Moranbacteria bacterium]|nr:DUF721 domain-containing protein [Candidatus Moranbacteria bacterium]
MKSISEMMKSKSRVQVRPKRVDADEKTIFFLAEKVVLGLYGVRGRENIVPRYWKGGKLFFSCQSPLWANELWITREILSEKINQELGNVVVKEIKVSE